MTTLPKNKLEVVAIEVITGFDESALSEEEQAANTKANEEWADRVEKDIVYRYPTYDPAKGRWMINGTNFDDMNYVTIALEKRGRYIGEPLMTIIQSAVTKEMRFYGDLAEVSTMVATSFMQSIDFNKYDDEFMLEDIETGEMEPAGNLIRSLMAPAPNMDAEYKKWLKLGNPDDRNMFLKWYNETH